MRHYSRLHRGVHLCGAAPFHFFLFPFRILVYTIFRQRRAGEKTRQEGAVQTEIEKGSQSRGSGVPDMNFFNRAGIAGKKKPLFLQGCGHLEICSGGGCISLFGLPFLLAGLFIMQIPLGLIPSRTAPRGPSFPP